MPGGRRNLSRSGSGRPPQPIFSTTDDLSKSKLGLQCEGVSSKVVSPKHIPLPVLPQDSGLMFEVIMCSYTAMATFLQFLHLYRSVWWLPQSYTRYSMNFYLIDPYLVGFIGTILSRRLLYSLVSRAVMLWAPPSIWTVLQQLIRLFLLSLLMASLVWCTYNIMQNHPIVNIFYLCYPISVYFILFGLSVSPFFDVTSLPSISNDDAKATAQILGKPLHSCSMSPQTIREEVDYLKADFNIRMKQVLFSSVLNAYYAGFVPCCFAQNFLYYDIYWATQHLTFVWLGCFTMYLVHCFPVKYCDTLHRAALHLGRWARVEGRTMHLPSHIWSDTTLWHQGALVKHCKELYKAEGISNAAEPGNPSHTRFYSCFNNPALPLCVIVGLQLALVTLQVVILIRVSEWYQVVSLALLLFANYYTLFKLSRDYLVCWKVYKAEAMIQDKITGG
ncbi:transmembrane protein 39A [Macrosteles quadrilineatus]|uniref:transmembrane protein 39A n=1 Tax=Macrosteles quadrilineatus TaxID=74068 RepID=UPI0023E2C3B7|nr:transmembrane protein 39A [Macrosteles quadrilineatus]